MSEQNTKDLPTGLYWKGKKTEVDRIVLPFQTIETINESRATREKEKDSFFKSKPDTTWYNRLIWGDNKYIMASLLEEFAGKIDLIYIDPPFATGADFSVKIEVGDLEWTKEPSAIEDKAYRDTWGKGLDSYLQMMYDRLVLMRELLSEKGSIYVHCDYRVNSHLRLILEEIFGKNNYINEIIWHYKRWSNVAKTFQKMHDTIHLFSKSSDFTFNLLYQEYSNPEWIEDTVRGIVNGKLVRLKDEKGNYIKREKNNVGVPMHDVWEDINFIGPTASERIGYATQKPEALLERIIKASSNEGDLVADFFCGSGTTGAVAEKLGRRWILADIGRFAIHTTRKRLLDIEGCKPFVVQNLGKYERQYWQGVTFKKHSNEQVPLYEYIQFILKLYNAEPITGMMHIHGKKGKRLVHIGAVDSPVTLSEIQEAIAEVKKSKQDALDILGWEWEMGLHDVIEKEAKSSGVNLRLLYIPRDVMDPRAVEKGDIEFYELAYLDAEVVKNKYGEFVVELKDFAIPNLDLIPEDVRTKIKKWSDYIDYWAVDWDWNQDTFHNMWQSYRTRKDRTLLLKSDSHRYETKGKHLIMVKVIDIFGNDTTKLLEVNS